MATPNYKLKDEHAAAIGHVRQSYTLLDNAKLNKTGGIITGAIYQTTDASELNQLATKQYVLDNAGTGGGGSSHPDKIESQDGAKSTSVLCTTDGVFISDDSTVIGHISKDSTSMKIKCELDGIILSTNDLILKNKLEDVTIFSINTTGTQFTSAIRYSDPDLPVDQDGMLTQKKYVDNAINTAKQNITQLVDSDQTDGAKYKLQIANNQLEYFRGAEADDLYLKQFGTASNDGVVFQTNKSRYFFESDNVVDSENYVIFRNQFSSDPTNMYNKAGQLSLRYGYIDETTPNAYCSISSSSAEAGSQSTRLLLYPKTNANLTEITNKAMFNSRLGYEPGTDLSLVNQDSILKRSENDSRYYLQTTTLDGILPPQNAVSMNSKKLTSLADGTSNSDAVNLDQLTKARQGFSIVRKTTTTQTANTKVTGFSVVQESNAQKCYWDNANQCFLVSIPVGDASVDVQFHIRLTYNITATGNNATFVLRDFTNNTNYVDTFLYATKQNQNGYFTENLTIIKNFTTNRFVGLYVTAQNGNPPFANVDFVMQAITITTSTQVNLGNLINSSGTKSVSVDASGLKADQTGQVWNTNGGVIKGLPLDLYTELYSGDHCASLDYVNQTVSAQLQTGAQSYLTQADFYRFQPIGLANAFAFRNLVSQEDRFIIQTDIPANCVTFGIGESLRLSYWGTKTLTNDSVVTKQDVLDMIAGISGLRTYTAYVFVGDFIPDANFTFNSTPPNLITSVGNTNSGSSVRSIDINHTAIPFRSRIFIQKYSTQFATADNDESIQYWVIQSTENNINQTQTRICYESLSESVTQSIGFNIMWQEW